MTKDNAIWFATGVVIGCIIMAIGALIADDKIQEAYRTSEQTTPPWARHG